MPRLILIDLPKAHGDNLGLWSNGYPLHQGESEASLNYATLLAQENGFKADPSIVGPEHQAFLETIKNAGFEVDLLPFPEELNQIDSLHHDGIFIRDAGLSFEDLWIKARFSAKIRQKEAEVHAKKISERYQKKIVELPQDAYLEFGEVFYLSTRHGTYYFGGLSRSNQLGHEFVCDILKPDHRLFIESDGYHLDTVFSPVLNAENELIALLLTEGMIHEKSLEKLQSLDIEIIMVDPMDSSGIGEELGSYAINTLTAPGLLLNTAPFLTKGLEERLQNLGIQRFSSPLSQFKYAGGSYHCLTNEVSS